MHGMISEAYSEPSRTLKMALFAKNVNDVQPLTIFAESTLLNVRLGSGYVSGSPPQYVIRFFSFLAGFQSHFYKIVLIKKEYISFCCA